MSLTILQMNLFKYFVCMILDEDTLKHLEDKLAQAEQDVINANLDEKLRVLTSARVQQVVIQFQHSNSNQFYKCDVFD